MKGMGLPMQKASGMGNRLNHWRRRCLVAGLLLGAGLAHAQGNADGVHPAPPPGREEAAEATLYVLNVSGPTLFASSQDITDNGAALVSLPRNTYQRVRIPPGAHEFRFKAFPQGRRVARLEAQAGQTYYLVVGYNPGTSWAFPLAGDPMLIQLVAEDVATPLMQHMQALPAR